MSHFMVRGLSLVATSIIFALGASPAGTGTSESEQQLVGKGRATFSIFNRIRKWARSARTSATRRR